MKKKSKSDETNQGVSEIERARHSERDERLHFMTQLNVLLLAWINVML